MENTKDQPFSTRWVIISIAIFIIVELLLGGFVGKFVFGRFFSLNLLFLIQGLLHLSSFFVGGFIIGMFSPGRRIFEPAVGAFLSVALVLLLSIFTPFRFIRFTPMVLIIGGAVAFLLALYGASLGERLMGDKSV